MNIDPTTTLNQLGGYNRLRAMIAIHSLSHNDKSLSFGFRGSRRFNRLTITLTPADLYDIDIGQIRGVDYISRYTADGLYWDQLKPAIERVTGLALSL